MLSSEGSTLTELILARHSLICRAVELDSRFEALALLQSAQDTCAADEPAQAPGSFSRYRRRVSAELVLLPALVEDLEGQIERAWRRLDVVSPKISG